MKINEIAKAVGQDNAKVAEAFGIEQSHGYWLKEVDDAKAAEYIAAVGGAASVSDKKATGEVPQARFWFKGRWVQISGGPDMGFDLIAAKNWLYTCPTDSAEAKLLRGPDAWALYGAAEVLPEPYAGERKRFNFFRFLKSLMYTGVSEGEGASREGRDQVMALLSDEDRAALLRKEKNTPDALAEVVVSRISLNVDSFGVEGKE